MEQSENSRDFYAQTYDVSVSDWPGELDFYHDIIDKVVLPNMGSVLEVACGTGRITIRLAQDGVDIVGLDMSSEMLEVARQKSNNMPNLRWIQGDMRAFDLGEVFDLILIPGQSFHNLLTPEDQVACLSSVKRHLNPLGTLVIHLDHQEMDWLGTLVGEQGGVFEQTDQFQHPQTGHQIRTLNAWSYEPATQTAVKQTVWEEIDRDGAAINRTKSRKVNLHCVFRFEMEHLLARVGFKIKALYGHFSKQPLWNESAEMIWVVEHADTNA